MRQKYDQGEDPLDPESQQGGGHPFRHGGQQFHFTGGKPFGGGPFQFKFHFNWKLGAQNKQREIFQILLSMFLFSDCSKAQSVPYLLYGHVISHGCGHKWKWNIVEYEV